MKKVNCGTACKDFAKFIFEDEALFSESESDGFALDRLLENWLLRKLVQLCNKVECKIDSLELEVRRTRTGVYNSCCGWYQSLRALTIAVVDEAMHTCEQVVDGVIFTSPIFVESFLSGRLSRPNAETVK